VEVKTTGDVRTVEIRSRAHDKATKPQEESNALAKLLLKKLGRNDQKMQIDLRGLGVSVVDQEPKELMYISIFKINFSLQKWNEVQQTEGERVIETLTEFNLKVDHMQIDNMVHEMMPVLFSPTKELVKDDLAEKDENYTPFLQVILATSELQEEDVYIKKYKFLQFSLQEMKLEVETTFLNALALFNAQISSARAQKEQFIVD